MATEILTLDHPGHFLNQFNHENLALVIDENVYRYHGDYFSPYTKILITSGEKQKNLRTAEMIISFLMDTGLDRNATIVGIGGGVVCDLTGFAASIYLRGVNFGFLPTTLLAMGDAAIGGKNGVNVRFIKNMIGLIRQPQFIAYYLPFLDTLPQQEFSNGMAEIIKHAFIEGRGFIDYLLNKHLKIKAGDKILIGEMIKRSYRVKSGIVEQDTYDRGMRKKLNLGHTIGHAIETDSTLAHGQCIAIGMIMSAKIAQRKSLCQDNTVRLFQELLGLFDLPVNTNIDHEIVMNNIAFDKKRDKDLIDFVLPIEPGKVEIHSLGIEEVEDHIKQILNG